MRVGIARRTLVGGTGAEAAIADELCRLHGRLENVSTELVESTPRIEGSSETSLQVCDKTAAGVDVGPGYGLLLGCPCGIEHLRGPVQHPPFLFQALFNGRRSINSSGVSIRTGGLRYVSSD